MKFLVTSLSWSMLILSSGAFLELIKDGGAREQGLANATEYVGPLTNAPLFWGIACVVAIGLVMLRRPIAPAKPLQLLLICCIPSLFSAEFPKNAIGATALLVSAAFLIAVHVRLAQQEQVLGTLGTFFQIVVGISFWLILFAPSYGIAVGEEHAGLWQGAFNHKNNLGGFAALTTTFTFWRWQYTARRRFVVLWLAAAALLIGSGSWTSTAGALLAMLLLAALRSRALRTIINSHRYLVFGTIVALSTFALYSAITNALDFEQEKVATFSNRNLIWLYLISKISTLPVFGFGLEQLAALNSASDEFLGAVGFNVASAHNGFLETTFAVGLVGLGALLYFLFAIVRHKIETPLDALAFTLAMLFIVVNTFESRALSLNVFFVFLVYIDALRRRESAA